MRFAALLVLLGVWIPISAAQAASRPNVLRLARMMDPATLDPILAMPIEDLTLVYLLYQPLVDLRDGANLFGNGASSWTLSPDARTFTFMLRPEARFSNGRPVVAADYAFTLERAALPATACPLQGYASGIRGFQDLTSGRTNHLAGLRVPDSHTLIVELDHPDPVFPYMLAMMIGFPLPAEEATEEPNSFRHRSVGNGPYPIRAISSRSVSTAAPWRRSRA